MLVEQSPPSIERVTVKINENWYVKLPGRDRIFLVTVAETTKATVSLAVSLSKSRSTIIRYKASDIEWVEKRQ